MGLQAGELFVRVGASVEGFAKGMDAVLKTVGKVVSFVDKGVQAIDQFAQSVKKFAGGLAQVAAPVSLAFGALLATAGKYNDEVAGEMQRAKDGFAQLAGDLSAALLPMLKQVADWVGQVANAYRSLSSEQKAQVNHWIQMGAALAAGVVGFSKLANAFAGVAQGVATATKFLSTFKAGLMGAAPMVLAIAAGLAGLLMIIDSVGELLDSWGTSFTEVFKEAWEGLKNFLIKVAKALRLGWLVEKIEDADILGTMGKLGAEAAKRVKGGLNRIGLGGIFDQLTALGAAVSDQSTKVHVKSIKDITKAKEDAAKKELETARKNDQYIGHLMENRRKHFEELAKYHEEMSKKIQHAQALEYARSQGMTVKEGTGRIDRTGAPGQPNAAKPDMRGPKQVLYDQAAAAAAELGRGLLAAAGTTGSMITGVMEQVAAGTDVFTIVGQIVTQLLTMSQSFQTVVGMLDYVLQMFANLMGQVFNALKPAIGGLFIILDAVGNMIGPVLAALAPALEALGPLFVMIGGLLQGLVPILTMLGNIIGTILKPAIDAISKILRLVFIGILVIFRGLAFVWNGIVDAVQSVLRWIGDFEIFGKRPLGFLKDWAAGLEVAKINTDQMYEAQKMLEHNTVENAYATANNTAAQVEAAAAGRDMKDTMEKVGEELTNVPSGFKIAAARYGATDVATPGAGALMGAGVPPAFSIEVKSAIPEDMARALVEYLRRIGWQQSGGLA